MAIFRPNFQQGVPQHKPAKPGSLHPASSVRDPRIAWHMRVCRSRYGVPVSELAVELALRVHERGNTASHEWEAINAMSIHAVLESKREALNDQAERGEDNPKREYAN